MSDPSLIDSLGFVWFAALFLGVPALGWGAMVLDYRAYLRGLRRALVVVRGYALDAPLWAVRARPECLTHLGLPRDCSRDDVLAAYRRLVKRAHPDLGGDRREFDRLQRSFREAIRLVDEE